eukprot:TRINITY_DN6909_c0_g1_i1.p1 TRINITY_DN6909_c0_g1~~TRINITY_DN6909_c0_g1_i1.p1  ORF type:complete len:391 (+),score=74.83 TRINITY_DN6909_c0_g1_i1:396-1568(+)
MSLIFMMICPLFPKPQQVLKNTTKPSSYFVYLRTTFNNIFAVYSDTMNTNMSILKKNIELTIETVKIVKKEKEKKIKNDKFVEILKPFIQNADGTIKLLCKDYSEAQQEFSSLVQFFAEDEKKCSFEILFGVLSKFIDLYKKAQQDLKNEREREAREQLRAQNREKRLQLLQQQRRENRSNSILSARSNAETPNNEGIWDITNMRQAIREGNIFSQRREALQDGTGENSQQPLTQQAVKPPVLKIPRFNVPEGPKTPGSGMRSGNLKSGREVPSNQIISPKVAMESNRDKTLKDNVGSARGDTSDKSDTIKSGFMQLAANLFMSPKRNKSESESDSDTIESSDSESSSEETDSEDSSSSEEPIKFKKVFPRAIVKKDKQKKNIFAIFKKK